MQGIKRAGYESATPIQEAAIPAALRGRLFVRDAQGELVAEINKQIVADTPIWEHKTFLPVPALADTDGPILKFRKWYSQFYAEPAEADA